MRPRTNRQNHDAVFLDANVLMYAVGSDEALRTRCQTALRAAVAQRVNLVTSAEVLQEILYRFFSINRPDSARTVYGTATELCSEILPVTERHTARALDLLLQHRRLSPRDALHVATMEDRGIRRLLSTDRDFDALEMVDRIDPATLAGPLA